MLGHPAGLHEIGLSQTTGTTQRQVLTTVWLPMLCFQSFVIKLSWLSEELHGDDEHRRVTLLVPVVTFQRDDKNRDDVIIDFIDETGALVNSAAPIAF